MKYKRIATLFFALLFVLKVIGQDELHMACKEGNFNKVTDLIERGFSLSQTNKHGFYPIHYAASIGSKEIAEYLISKGSPFDEFSKNSVPITPLMEASSGGHLDVVKLLIDKGAEINKKNDKGQYSLFYAINKNRYEVVQYLISEGSIVDDESFGMSPLGVASLNGTIEIVKLLTENGANINRNNSTYPPPLVGAVMSRNLKTVDFLAKKGANMNIVSKYRDMGSPLHYASLMGNIEIVNYLLTNGANPLIQDGKASETPIKWAASKGFQDVVNMLKPFSPNLNVQINPQNEWFGIQELLSYLNNYEGELNGIMDKETRESIEKFALTTNYKNKELIANDIFMEYLPFIEHLITWCQYKGCDFNMQITSTEGTTGYILTCNGNDILFDTKKVRICKDKNFIDCIKK